MSLDFLLDVAELRPYEAVEADFDTGVVELGVVAAVQFDYVELQPPQQRDIGAQQEQQSCRFQWQNWQHWRPA